MHWIPNPNDADSPPVIGTSQAADAGHLMCDLWLTLHHMFQGRDALGAAGATRLYLHANATNGHIDWRWADDTGTALGGWVYTLRLPQLFADSLEHADGAGHLEEVIDTAVHCLVEDYWGLCDGEVATGCREGLRPLNWGRRRSGEAQDYSHAAYDVTMPQTPLEFYITTDARPTPHGVYL